MNPQKSKKHLGWCIVFLDSIRVQLWYGVKKARKYVDNLVDEGKVVYGITTGFGKFSDIIISKDEYAISGGNFHGQPMALAFDFLGIAIAELANVSERRIERLVNPQLSGLPAFLTEKGER